MKHNKLFIICICIVATLFCNALSSMANASADSRIADNGNAYNRQLGIRNGLVEIWL